MRARCAAVLCIDQEAWRLAAAASSSAAGGEGSVAQEGRPGPVPGRVATAMATADGYQKKKPRHLSRMAGHDW